MAYFSARKICDHTLCWQTFFIHKAFHSAIIKVSEFKFKYIMSNKLYKVTARHDKGYDLEFDPFFLTEKGMKSFVSDFEKQSKGKFFMEKIDTGYRIETDTYLNIVEYELPVFLDEVSINEVSFCNEGYGSTWFSIE